MRRKKLKKISIDEAARTFRVLSKEEQRAIKGGTWYYIPQEDRLEFSGSGNDIKIHRNLCLSGSL